jgi:hypothetical protein
VPGLLRVELTVLWASFLSHEAETKMRARGLRRSQENPEDGSPRGGGSLLLGLCRRPNRVRHAGPAGPKRLAGAFGGVLNSLVLDLGVQFSPDKDDDA